MLNRESLYKAQLNHHKFYLSFENALCEDYVTEKFFLALNAGIIPIVYGGTDVSTYELVSAVIK